MANAFAYGGVTLNYPDSVYAPVAVYPSQWIQPDSHYPHVPIGQLQDAATYLKNTVEVTEANARVAGIAAEATARANADAVLAAYAAYVFSTAGTLNNNVIPPASGGGTSGFSLNGANGIVVPAAGVYEVTFSISVKMSSTANPQQCELDLRKGGSTIVGALTTRFSTSANDYVHLTARAVVTITTPASEAIDVFTNSGGGTYTPATGSAITIRRIS